MNKHRTALRLIAIIGLAAGSAITLIGGIGYGSVEEALSNIDVVAMDGFADLAAFGTTLFAIGALALLLWLLGGSLANDLRANDLRANDLRTNDLRTVGLRADHLRVSEVGATDPRTPDLRAVDRPVTD
jgi:hypothetical protein